MNIFTNISSRIFRGYAASRALALCLLLFSALYFAGCASPLVTVKGKTVSYDDIAKTELDEKFAPSKYALIIGVNEFKDKDAWHNLRYAAKDATDLAATLKSKEALKFDEIILLNTPELTTRENILSSVEKLANLSRSKKDIVIVYISTHGTLSRNNKGDIERYIVASNTYENKIDETGVKVDEIMAKLSGIKSQRKAAILAFCHSGRGKSHLNPNMMTELKKVKGSFFAEPIIERSEANIILTACAWGETALEDERLENDIYTYFLMEAINSHWDTNGDGATTISEAHDFARERTYNYTKGKQRPGAVSDILGADPIVLSGKPERDGRPVLFSYNRRFDDITVKVNGTAKGKLPSSIPLEAGLQQITLVKGDDDVVFDENLKLGPGQFLEVEEMFNKSNSDTSIGMGGGAISMIGFSDWDGLASVAPVGVISVKNRGLLPLKMFLQADLGVTGYSSDQTISDVGVNQTFIGGFATVAALYQRRIWELEPFVGPRIGGMYMLRKFTRQLSEFETGDKSDGVQQMLSPYSGVIGGLSYISQMGFDARLEVGASHFFVNLDDDTIHGLNIDSRIIFSYHF